MELTRKIYIVTEINGDYAKLSHGEEQFEISLFLLPENLELGDRVLSENMVFSKL